MSAGLSMMRPVEIDCPATSVPRFVESALMEPLRSLLKTDLGLQVSELGNSNGDPHQVDYRRRGFSLCLAWDCHRHLG